MTKVIVAAGLGAVLGLAVGFAAFSAPPPLPPPDCPPPPACPACPQCEACPTIARPLPGTAPPPSGATDTASLTARVADLEARLSAEVAKTQGTARPFPQGLDPKYTEPQLVQGFRDGLREAGFTADVRTVDCTEYPCIVFGSGFGAAGDSAKLKATRAFQGYADSNFTTRGWNAKHQNPNDRFFGMALLPPGENMTEDQRKRLDYRLEQMWEASRPKDK